MKNLQKIFMMIAAVAGMTLAGCSKDDDNKAAPGDAQVKVHMTDAPGDFDAVFIEVVDVRVKGNDDNNDDNWVSLGNVVPGTYNLLELTGGATVLLADHSWPAGYVGQIRLILGENNYVVKDGVSYPLNTPSAQQSGLKLQIKQTLQAGIVYDFLIDFDVAQSIVVAGNSGNINLHPVLRVTTAATTGAIKGVFPVPGVQAVASVIVGGETINAYTDATGVFVLHGIPAGTYTVTLTPDVASGIAVATYQNTVVTTGNITDLGTLPF